jgi:hypothetical protein
MPQNCINSRIRPSAVFGFGKSVTKYNYRYTFRIRKVFASDYRSFKGIGTRWGDAAFGSYNVPYFFDSNRNGICPCHISIGKHTKISVYLPSVLYNLLNIAGGIPLKQMFRRRGEECVGKESLRRSYFGRLR